MEPGRQVIKEVSHQPVPSLRQVLRHAADAKPARMHASAADGLDDIEHPLAVGEHEKYRRQGAQILRIGAVEHQVAGDAKKLGHHHADYLHPVGHFDAGQLFHCQHIGEVVHNPAQIVDAVGIGNIGMPGLALAHFFGAAVVKADIRHGVDDFLAIEL